MPNALWPLRPPSALSCCRNPAAITMSLQQASQSRVFVELVPWADRGRENNLVSGEDTLLSLRRPFSAAQAQTVSREVHVSGTAEVAASPDRAQVAVRISSTKEAAAEVKKSVCRRLDYITQSLQQQGLQAENVTVTKDFRRVENAYHMEAEPQTVSTVIAGQLCILTHSFYIIILGEYSSSHHHTMFRSYEVGKEKRKGNKPIPFKGLTHHCYLPFFSQNSATLICKGILDM
ncbi:interleukin-1 receptor-associated kinase 1-binding protein 1 isoform X2 [Rousettus aegyptiacus]|uniref:interleukin-1 receptor-associated kinase 1-binding protein 1 isoform X2 n=1 Tax=Rousettus aegyptiacus TaxID=9407 RepID=UPI00168D5AAA|nr:interleukin-1 receptor-associated kinase 1-binding protein 1 isoform X2 [Rousettus aegyptiacus]